MKWCPSIGPNRGISVARGGCLYSPRVREEVFSNSQRAGRQRDWDNIGDMALARLTHRVIEHLLLEVQDVEHALRHDLFCDVECVVACASRSDLVDSLGGCI